MRVVDQNAPTSPNNQGTVIYHAGANVARLWKDFQQFSQPDQELFDELLPELHLNFGSLGEIEIQPRIPKDPEFEVKAQTDIRIEEIPLLEDDAVRKAIEFLRTKGVTPEQYQNYEPVLPTKQIERRANRQALASRVQIMAGAILKEHGLSFEGKLLDKKRLGRSNYKFVLGMFNNKLNAEVGRKAGERAEFTQQDLETINRSFEKIANEVRKEVKDATS